MERRETFIAKKVSSKITGCNLSSGYENDDERKGFQLKFEPTFTNQSARFYFP